MKFRDPLKTHAILYYKCLVRGESCTKNSYFTSEFIWNRVTPTKPIPHPKIQNSGHVSRQNRIEIPIQSRHFIGQKHECLAIGKPVALMVGFILIYWASKRNYAAFLQTL